MQVETHATGAGNGASDAPEGVNGSAELTERLLDAAVEVFAERGFEAARVAEIARRAGVTTGAIYARWPGKRDLIAAAIRHTVPKYMQTPSLVAATPADEVAAALGGDRASAQSARVRDVMLEALVSARRDDSFGYAVSDAMSGEAARLSDIVARGKADGCIDPELSTTAVVALCQALGLGMRLAAASETDGAAAEAADWDALVSRMSAALRPLTAERPASVLVSP